ncbi:MAG: AMP nucleosidase [Candidatus Abyssobacteria bacterium SURF_5]|uniref:AMP nucleosidase n=1 Tax=Abyssobacteria bacterium (strain SURF_5) TaxID=2093360 RepID=A0A3A4NGQ3_ABYX5|nr:MAG: AMP nucleosidase [Candidatus Abyssubacteria bacterium SURF_5]
MGKNSRSSAEALREKIGRDSLERYTNSPVAEFQPFILLTNFSHYMTLFNEASGRATCRGSLMEVCHWPEEQISILNFGVGSPMAALVIDLLAFVDPLAILMLGMCGGLRKKHRLGDFFNTVAAIRDEGTSNHYMPPGVPALASFTVQKAVTTEVEAAKRFYHTGVVHTTNYRMWEFDDDFRAALEREKVSGIEMECATLFSAGFSRNLNVGALLLISDLPRTRRGIKTKESSKRVFKEYAQPHLEIGINVMRRLREMERGLLKKQW